MIMNDKNADDGVLTGESVRIGQAVVYETARPLTGIIKQQ